MSDLSMVLSSLMEIKEDIGKLEQAHERSEQDRAEIRASIREINESVRDLRAVQEQGFDGNGNAAVPHIILSSADLSNTVRNAANKGVSSFIDLFNPAATRQQTRMQFHITHRRALDTLSGTYIGAGCRNVSQKTTNIRFLFSGAGNVIASGRITMLGRRKIQ